MYVLYATSNNLLKPFYCIRRIKTGNHSQEHNHHYWEETFKKKLLLLKSWGRMLYILRLKKTDV